VLSLNQIRSTLKSRIDEPLHKQWSVEAQAAIVILWGLLIYPQLDIDLKKQWKSKGYIEKTHFENLFEAYSEDYSMKQLLQLLEKNDYIRIDDKQRIRSGTQLFSAVHALRMYRFFRSSVLSRQLFQALQKTSSSS
jgi:hypothetical protein